MKIPQKEIARYLGYKRGQTPDEKTLLLIEDCINELKASAAAKYTERKMPLSLTSEGVCIGNWNIHSKNLLKHLSDCSEVLLFGATLGIQTDILLNRYSKTDVSRCAVMQATAAAMIESFCDECCETIGYREARRGLHLKPRYSPGYGDFAIEHQEKFLKLINAERRLGLTATDGFMLTPSKSVTAVIGLTSGQSNCTADKCEMCTNSGCAFRR